MSRWRSSLTGISIIVRDLRMRTFYVYRELEILTCFLRHSSLTAQPPSGSFFFFLPRQLLLIRHALKKEETRAMNLVGWNHLTERVTSSIFPTGMTSTNQPPAVSSPSAILRQ